MDFKEIINEKLAELNLYELESVLESTLDENEMILGDISVGSIMNNLINGNAIFDTEVIIENVKTLFLYELQSTLVLGLEILTVTILIGLLKSISSSFGERAVSNMSMLVSGCFIIGLCLSNFKENFDICSNTVDTMTHTMQILLPVIIPLLIATGGVTSGGLLSPLLTATITSFNTIMSNIILPGIYVSTIMFMINSLTERDYVGRLAGFLRNASVFICGVCVTFFTGVTVMQGFVSEAADGLMLNTARFSINNLIPVVGSFAADSLDMIILCTKAVKNGVGLFGIIVLLVLMAVPVIKLLAIALMYKITSIVTEPLGNRQISECLSQMGNAVILMCVIIFLTSIMFLLYITIIIGLGN